MDVTDQWVQCDMYHSSSILQARLKSGKIRRNVGKPQCLSILRDVSKLYDVALTAASA